ncbi:MAG: S-adenosylmethionine:tRNA ribosyltransferase-isomerase, partial [Fibrobacteria bacterium]
LPARLQERAGATDPFTVPLTASPEAWTSHLQIRLARRWEDGAWSILPLTESEEPWRGDLRGMRLVFSAGFPHASVPGCKADSALSAQVLGPDPHIDRLWKIRFSLQGQDLMEALSRLGDPVRYWYASAPWNLDYYQTVYAREPGSVEMPSAGRAFTWKLLLELRRKGIGTAFLVLHAGLSSYLDEEFDAGHPASVEPFRLEGPAAEAINAAKARGGRVIAVGTTVVRALESIADESGRVHAEAGATRLRIVPGYALKSVDGLLTGFHEPSASHLDLLTAFLPPQRLESVYAAALEGKYLWHEFGDMNLIL